MANLEFYAVEEDIQSLVDFLLGTDFVIYESYSRFDCKLRTFGSSNEIIKAYREVENRRNSPFFMAACYHSSFAGNVVIEKTKFIPGSCNGHKFRYSVSGWGLFHIDFGGISSAKTITPSRFSHNSGKRAHTWDDTYDELGKGSDWDWRAVSKLSRQIQSFIKKNLAVRSKGARPVLLHAARLCEIDALELEERSLT